MMLPSYVGLLPVLAVFALAAAEQKPDFSGEWVLDRAASTLSPGADGMESAVLRITHREPQFRIEARFVPAGGKPIEWSFDRTTDGREISSNQNGVASLAWDGDALVAADRTVRPEFEFRMSWRYELVDGGTRLRATEWLRATNRSQDNVWIFNRR